MPAAPWTHRLPFPALCRGDAGLLDAWISGHLTIWCLVFLLVTLQMPTTLRPIIGESGKFLNLEEKRFFLQYWSEQITGELSGERNDEGRSGADLHD